MGLSVVACAKRPAAGRARHPTHETHPGTPVPCAGCVGGRALDLTLVVLVGVALGVLPQKLF